MICGSVDAVEQKTGSGVFIARQPIFRRDLQVFGFDLLYPVTPESEFEAAENPAKLLANVFLSVGIDKLAGEKPAFIRFDRRTLTPDLPSILPKRPLVIELPKSLSPTRENLELCAALRFAGHEISIADCRDGVALRAWAPVAGYARVDFRTTTDAERRSSLHCGGGGRLKFIAAEIKSHTDYEHAVELGFDYFQGFHLAQPTVVGGRVLTEARAAQLRVLQEVACDEIDMYRVEKLIQQDVSLTYKLLRYINSAAFAWRGKIKSVRHAMSLMGESELRRWACMIIIMSLGGPKASQLFLASLVRAEFGHLLASRVGMERQKDSMFLLGLLSYLDVILGCSMLEVVEDLALHQELRDALLQKEHSKRSLGGLFHLIEAYDLADWPRALAFKNEFRVDHLAVMECYIRALEWAELVAAL